MMENNLIEFNPSVPKAFTFKHFSLLENFSVHFIFKNCYAVYPEKRFEIRFDLY